MLHLHFSNRFESLRETLLKHLARETPGPFTAQEIIIPSAAITRHLQWALTEHQGICANVNFSYLAQWIWRQIGQLVEIQTESPFAPEVLTWRIYRALGDPEFISAYTPLQRYLSENNTIRQYDLAGRIAHLFENYVTYRPLWLQAWSAGQSIRTGGQPAGAALQQWQHEPWQHESWQSTLWRRIARETATTEEHPGQSFFRLLPTLHADSAALASLPLRAHVFCLPSMPPLYLQMLRGLSSRMDLHLYVLNPCKEYWYELVDRKRLSQLSAKGRSEHQETGNALLAAWGKQTQATIDLLLTGDEVPESLSTDFVEAPVATMLGQLQNSILNLLDLDLDPDPSMPAEILPITEDDQSLQIDVCHSLQRELDVLHARLQDLLGQPDAPAPEDILVVTPDLQSAAPLIDAVFGTVRNKRRLPYVITGLPQRRVNPIARILDQLLSLALGRHPASEVFDLLIQPAVMRRFGLDLDQAARLREWIRVSGIRWALDGDERQAHGLPADERHTFAEGLERLYLAYAMGDDDANIDFDAQIDFGEHTPFDRDGAVRSLIGAGNPGGSQAPALGILWRFVQALDRIRREWQESKTPDEWHQAMSDALTCFAAEDPAWIEDFIGVRRALHRLHTQMIRGGLGDPLPLTVLRQALTEQLEQDAQGGVPSGRITFAAISSLRALPYRNIFVFGMNDGAFPSASRLLEFDLIAAQPQRGDRQRRLDERNQFLDLFISARDRLVLSYTGRNIRDNSRIPPSVLIADLIDQVERIWPGSSRRIIHEHPLQSFSNNDFGTGDLQTRDLQSRDLETRNLAASDDAPEIATDLFSADEESDDSESMNLWVQGVPFFNRELPPPDASLRAVSLDRFIEFFRNPARFLLRHRLGIQLTDEETDLLDEEPFATDPLTRHQLVERLLPKALAGMDANALARLALAGPELPSGALGTIEATDEAEALYLFAQPIRQALTPPPLDPITQTFEFDLDGEVWTVRGTLSDLRATGLVRWSFRTARAQDYLSGWITHLFLCACDATLATAPKLKETSWYSRDGIYRLRTVVNPKSIMAQLIALYRTGLSEPLHFYPRSAWALANTGKITEALKTWQCTRNHPFGESADPAYQLALRGVNNPIGPQFAELALQIYQPLLDHLEDARLTDLEVTSP
jgi:exodeoxyribonuclease V gamma subunit